MRFEAGETAYSISKSMGGRPSKPGIAKRAVKEGWKVPDQGNNQLPIVAAALNIDSRKLTDQLLQTILGLIGIGATEQLACQAAGISQNTFITWKGQDPRLKDAVHRARAGKLCQWIGRIDKAGETDWKADQALLQASKETRDQFGKGNIDSKVQVTINIDRGDGGLVIEGETA